MTAPKVYRTGIVYSGSGIEWRENGVETDVPGRRHLGVVAIVTAKSWVEALALFRSTTPLRNLTMSEIKFAGSITGNAVEIEVALSEPGAVFAHAEGGGRTVADWIKVSS